MIRPFIDAAARRIDNKLPQHERWVILGVPLRVSFHGVVIDIAFVVVQVVMSLLYSQGHMDTWKATTS